MKLVELRSAEADFRTATHSPVAVLPIGAVEQHSRHLPLGTDALIVELVAEEVERRIPQDVMLLPTIHVGASDHHLSMPGTMSVGTLTVADSVTRRCLSLARSSGIAQFLILNGHGGNQPAGRLALEQIRTADTDIQAFAADYWALMFEALDAEHRERPSSMGHADIIETSILLTQRPELVHLDLAVEDGYLDEFSAAVAATSGIPERTKFGGVGDPRAASAALGSELFEAAVSATERLVRQVLRASPTP